MVSATRAFRAQLISKYVIVGDGALALGVIAEALQRQRLEVGALLLEHGLDLAPGAAVDARRRPPSFPLLQEGVLLFDGLEAAGLERGALRVLNCVLDCTLAVRVTHPRRISDNAVVGQYIPVHGVQFRFVQVGLDDTFLDVVEDHVAAAAEVAPCLFVQPGPDLPARLPHHPAEASPGVALGHHEQPGLAVAKLRT